MTGRRAGYVSLRHAAVHNPGEARCIAPLSAPTLVTEVERVTKNIAETGRVTKPAARSVSVTPPVTKKRGRPAASGQAMTPAEKQRAFRERQKAAKTS